MGALFMFKLVSAPKSNASHSYGPKIVDHFDIVSLPFVYLRSFVHLFVIVRARHVIFRTVEISSTAVLLSTSCGHCELSPGSPVCGSARELRMFGWLVLGFLKDNFWASDWCLVTKVPVRGLRQWGAGAHSVQSLRVSWPRLKIPRPVRRGDSFCTRNYTFALVAAILSNCTFSRGNLNI